MNDWYGTAKSIIATVHGNLPADADLVTRREACLRAKPWEFATTSWGRKVWARAQREYLVKYGYVPKNDPRTVGEQGMRPLLSPLERAKAATEEHQANVARIQSHMAQLESELDRKPA